MLTLARLFKVLFVFMSDRAVLEAPLLPVGVPVDCPLDENVPAELELLPTVAVEPVDPVDPVDPVEPVDTVEPELEEITVDKSLVELPLDMMVE